MKIYHSFSSRETRTLGAVAAEKVLAAVGAGHRRKAVVLSLYGELGAGKTTFVQGFLRALGVRKRVTSPTFVLIKKFSLGTNIRESGLEHAYHVDAYRLNALSDTAPLGLAEIIADPRAVVLVEWPERLRKTIPQNAAKVRFSHGDKENERIIKTSGGVLS